MSDKRGRFVVTEGLDGAGTSTQAKAIAQALRDCGEHVEETFEPSERPIGKLLRRYLSGELPGPSEAHAFRRMLAMLFAADRQDHLASGAESIEARLARGESVVCARYVLSSLAYEGDHADEFAFVASLNEGFLVPDLTVYLEGSVELSLARLQGSRDQLDIFENEAKLASVKRGYELALESWEGPVLVADASQPAERITQSVIEILNDGGLGAR